MARIKTADIQGTTWLIGNIGQVLIAVYSLNVIANSLPMAWLDAEWQLKMASLIQSGAGFPLVGTTLMLLARDLSINDSEIRRRVRLVQRLAAWVAIGFLLLIPLEMTASIRNLNHLSGQEHRVLTNLLGSIKAIETAGDGTALKNAITSLPGGPNQLNGTIQGSVQEVKTRLAVEIKAQARQLETKIAEINHQRWLDTLKNWLRDLPSCLLYAFAFQLISGNLNIPLLPSKRKKEFMGYVEQLKD